MLWVICGAGKGVGKTHLSLALCSVLPNAAYAKLGHGAAKPGKPANFFTCPNQFEAFVTAALLKCSHVVAESNAWAIEGRGDLRVFVDGIPTTRSARGDAEDLRSGAQIVVGTEGSVDTWQQCLSRHLSDRELCHGVCQALLEHSAYLRSALPAVRCQASEDPRCEPTGRETSGSEERVQRWTLPPKAGAADPVKTVIEN